MTRRFALMAVLAVTLGALPLAAQGRGARGGGPPPIGPGPGILPMLQQLDLTEAQKTQIHTLLEADRPSGEARGDERNLHAQIFADTPDDQAIDALKASLNAAHAAELDHQVELMRQIARILTPEQRQALLKMPPPGGRGRGRGQK